MKDLKIPIGWLVPIIGVILLLGWFLGRSGWNVTEVDTGVAKLAPPTATIMQQPTLQTTVTSQQIAQQPTAQPSTPRPASTLPCPSSFHLKVGEEFKPVSYTHLTLPTKA